MMTDKEAAPEDVNMEQFNQFQTVQYDDAQIEKGRKFFAQPCQFLKGVVSINDLPQDARVEVAFAGRSNVGKSSLLNAIVNQKTLARTSNTPGRTREINYFTVTSDLYLVDMPGYGYARASKTLVAGWTNLIENYLKGRSQLRRLFLLIDSRHGLKENDITAMKLMDVSAVSYQIVLTKLDKLKVTEQKKVIQSVCDQLKKHPAAFPQVIPTSSKKGKGIDLLRASILELL